MNEPGQRFHRLLDGATVGLFFALILAPMSAMWLGAGASESADESEKRTLASAPARPRSWSAAVRWPDEAEAFLRDRFGFRKTLIRWHSLMLYTVFRASSSPKVVLGRDDWLYYNGDVQDGRPIADYRGTEPLSPAQVEWLRWMVQDQHEWLQDRGIRYLFAIVPSKEQIHPERLPPAITRVGAKTPREQVLDHLAGRGLPVLDLAPVLLDAKAAAPVFYKTDTHWNSLGCLAANQAILDALGLPREADGAFDVRRLEHPGGDLAGMLNLGGFLREIESARVPRAPRRGRAHPVSDQDMCDIVGGVDDPALPRAVVYRDSFTEPLIPFLTEHFRDIRYIWARKGADMKRVPDLKPDFVLQIMADRVFRLNVKYSSEIQQERLRKRLDTASSLVWRLDAWSPDLPPLKDARTHLPVVRVDLTARKPMDLTLTWNRRDEARCRAQPGRSSVFLPVYDPEAEGPLRLRVGGLPRDFEIHSIELREILR